MRITGGFWCRRRHRGICEGASVDVWYSVDGARGSRFGGGEVGRLAAGSTPRARGATHLVEGGDFWRPLLCTDAKVLDGDAPRLGSGAGVVDGGVKRPSVSQLRTDAGGAIDWVPRFGF